MVGMGQVYFKRLMKEKGGRKGRPEEIDAV
jgi:hypothetical protein